MQKLIPAVLVSVILGACGGGGGGSAPAPTPAPTLGAINETNQNDVSGISYDSALLLESITTFAGAAGVQTSATRAKFDFKSLITLQVAEAREIEFLPATVVGAITTRTLPCNVSGTYVGTVDDADNSLTPTSGDKVNIVYTNCVTRTPSGANITRNGTTSFDFTKLTETELLATAAYQNLDVLIPATTVSAAFTVKMNGSITSSSIFNNATSTSTDGISIPSLSLASGAESLTYTNYQLNESVNTITGAYIKSGQGTFGATGLGTFNLSTPVPFQGFGSGRPSVGKLKIVGSDATAYVTAIDTFSAKLELDKGSDGTIDVTKTAAWGSF